MTPRTRREWLGWVLASGAGSGFGTALAGPVTGTPNATATPGDGRHELRIGASAALSGPAAALGLRFHAGAAALFNQVNRAGGVNGALIKLDLRDDGYEPARAEANTRALVEDPAVLALFGYVGTPTSQVALPYARRERLPFVGPFTGAGMLHEPGQQQVFNVRASYLQEGEALVRHMQSHGVRRLGVLYQADLFGRYGLEAIRGTLAQAGVALHQTATVRRNSAEVAEAVAALAGPDAGDAIALVSTYETCAAFIRQARHAGFKGRFYSLSFVGYEELMRALGRGRRHGVTVSQVVPDPRDRDLPVVLAAQKALAESGGAPQDRRLDSVSLEGYLAARVLVEGLRRAHPAHPGHASHPAHVGPLDRAGLQQALAQLGDLDLGGFRVHYREGQRRGSDYVGVREG